MLYGPRQAKLNIKLGDPNKDVSNGRAALHAKEAKDNNEQHAHDTWRANGGPEVGLKKPSTYCNIQIWKEAQLISIKMQLDLVGRQIERADKKEDNAKVEELKMKEEKLSTMMATILDLILEKEVRPRT